MQVGTKVRLFDDIEALTGWNNGPVGHFMGRVGEITKEIYPGIFRVYFPARDGGERGTERPFPGDFLVVEVEPAPAPEPLTLEDRVALLEAAVARLTE